MGKLGYLEEHYRLTDRQTGESVETVSTVSMFLRADDYADRLRMKREHTEQWIMKRFGWAVAALAAAHEGIFEMHGDIDEATLGEFVNRFAIEVVPEPVDDEPEENPTTAAQDGGPEA